MKVLINLFLAILLSQSGDAQITYAVKKKSTLSDSVITKKEIYSSGSLGKISGRLIPLSFKSKDTIYLSKTPFFAEDTFVLMLKAATPIYSYQIIVRDSKAGSILMASECSAKIHISSVNSLLNMITRGKNLYGLLYDFMYINSAGKSIKMDKNIVVLP